MMTIKNRAAVRSWNAASLVCFMCMGLVLFNEQIARAVTGEQPDNYLEVKALGFEEGKFYQLVVPEQSATIYANWAAKVTQGHVFICGGGDAAPYEQKTAPIELSPDLWTGGDCSAMVEGKDYTAHVVWSYWTRSGKFEQISREFSFTYSKSAI